MMPFWMSAIAAGSVATARLMSVAALSTASSSVRAWPSADSAARMASTSPPWRPPGGRPGARALVMFWSAKDSRCLAVSTLPATEASAVSANCVVQRGQRLLRRFDARRQVDHLLGQRVQPGRAR